MCTCLGRASPGLHTPTPYYDVDCADREDTSGHNVHDLFTICGLQTSSTVVGSNNGCPELSAVLSSDERNGNELHKEKQESTHL